MAEEIWTEERIELLKKLWNKDLEKKDIAAQLTNTLLTKGLKISENAVSGKIHRLRLSPRQPSQQKGLLFLGRARF